MARIDEIAPDLYRVSIYVPQFDLQFNHFLIKDDEPLLFHTGMRRMFPEVRDTVAQVIDPAALRWISWSHFEVDECGALMGMMFYVFDRPHRHIAERNVAAAFPGRRWCAITSAHDDSDMNSQAKRKVKASAASTTRFMPARKAGKKGSTRCGAGS